MTAAGGRSSISVLPTLALVILSSLMAIAFQAEPPRNGTPWPNMVLIVVFFWVVHKPSVIPLGLIFAIGLFRDLATGEILGAGLVVLVLGTIALRSASSGLSDTPFAVRWLSFIGFATLAIAGEHALTALAKLAIPPIAPVAWHLLATVLAYPVISVLFTRVFRVGRIRSDRDGA